MSTINPWLRLLQHVAGWAFASFCIVCLIFRANIVIAYVVMAGIFVVWPALIYWFRVPAINVKRKIIFLVMYIPVMALIGRATFYLAVIAMFSMS